MASFMPAACSPWAMDHAIERLLATPKTTPVRPCKSADMSAPYEWERITGAKCDLPRRHGDTEKSTVATPVNGGESGCHNRVQFTALVSSTVVATGQLAATNDRP